MSAAIMGQTKHLAMAATVALIAIAGCGGSGDDGGRSTLTGVARPNDAGEATPASAAPGTGGSSSEGAQAACVHIQAYQENYSADSVADILANARNCYVLIDPFSSNAARTAIAQMKQNGNTVGCYISVGTCEEWRDDFDALEPHCVDTAWGEWAGEYFVDQPNPQLIALMSARIDQTAGWGCDMVELDNMDWAFDDESRQQYGFRASAPEGIEYFQALCDDIHETGMLCMAKNTRRGAEGFDGGTFESYVGSINWWNNSHLQGFLDAGQLGVIVHYDESNCSAVYSSYQDDYGSGLSFICEDPAVSGYRHYNE